MEVQSTRGVDIELEEVVDGLAPHVGARHAGRIGVIDDKAGPFLAYFGSLDRFVGIRHVALALLDGCVSILVAA